MPKYKYTYFDVYARGEVVRLVFAVAAVEYEDIRINDPSMNAPKWVDFKHLCPFQALPVLELEDGTVLAQTNAIARYLSNEFGLAGKTNLEKAQVDMIADAVEEIFPFVRDYFFARWDKKPAMFEELFSSQLPARMTNLERALTNNNEGNGFFVGDSVTWVDLKFFSQIGENLKGLNHEFLKMYPKLDALVDRVAAIPEVRAWRIKRPKLRF